MQARLYALCPCNPQTPTESEQGILSLEVENKVKFRDRHKEAQEEDTAALRSKVIYSMIPRETSPITVHKYMTFL